jgi:hypothetical protein
VLRLLVKTFVSFVFLGDTVLLLAESYLIF